MNLRRLWAMSRKEFLHVLRDPLSLGLAIAIPIIQIFLFGYALTLDVDHVPLVVWDQSESPESRHLIMKFGGSPYFDIKQFHHSFDGVERAIDTGNALVALVIPRDYAQNLGAGRQASIQLIADGGDSNTATIALGYANAITYGANQEVLVERIRRAGKRPPRMPVDPRMRIWYNEDLASRNHIIPGLTAVIMSMIAALLTSLTVARERERGTLEQLISTPVRPAEVIIGKLVPYFVTGMFIMTLMVIMGVFVFGVPLRGSLFFLFAAASLFLVVALSQGMLISIIVKDQLTAAQAALVTTFLPAFLLSGFAYSIENMPAALRVVTHIVAARYYVTLLKGIYLKGVGITILWPETLLLAMLGALLLGVSIAAFRKTM